MKKFLLKLKTKDLKLHTERVNHIPWEINPEWLTIARQILIKLLDFDKKYFDNQAKMPNVLMQNESYSVSRLRQHFMPEENRWHI